MNSRATQLKFVSPRMQPFNCIFWPIGMLNWLLAAIKLHKHRGTCCTAEWPYCSFAILCPSFKYKLFSIYNYLTGLPKAVVNKESTVDRRMWCTYPLCPTPQCFSFWNSKSFHCITIVRWTPTIWENIYSTCIVLKSISGAFFVFSSTIKKSDTLEHKNSSML